MRIVVVSNTTMQSLASSLPGHDLVFGGVGDLQLWLADPSAPPADPTTDVVLVHADGEALVPPLGPAEGLESTLMLIEQFARTHPSTEVIVTSLLVGPRTASSYADALDPGGRVAARSTWDLRVAALAADQPNVAMLDLQLLLEDAGRRALISDSYWYLGRIRFSKLGFELFGRELEHLLTGLLNRSRKVLVLDLDNTLWGGVIGDDGMAGIALGEDGVGKCFRDFQHHVRDLRNNGVLLAVVSKNDPEPVDEVLTKHPMMVLRSEDFVRVVADWGNKADHIRALADDLSLALDTFVLLDDNPFERSLVESELPDVLAPDFPTRPELLSDWFLSEVVPNFFPRVRVLDADRAKTSQYHSRAERKRAAETNLDDFLASLDMRVSFRIDDANLTPRLSQLTQKTNQFNLSVERATPADVAAWMADPKMVVVACDYSDRFGDEGTIGLAVIDLDQATLRNLLLSCRVLGRGVEDLLLNEVGRILDEYGHSRFSARVVTTPRNGIARTFMNRHGFHARTSDDAVWIREEDTARKPASKTS